MWALVSSSLPAPRRSHHTVSNKLVIGHVCFVLRQNMSLSSNKRLPKLRNMDCTYSRRTIHQEKSPTTRGWFAICVCDKCLNEVGFKSLSFRKNHQNPVLKGQISSRNILKFSIFSQILYFWKFWKFENTFSPRLKTIFRPDFFICLDIFFRNPKHVFIASMMPSEQCYSA